MPRFLAILFCAALLAPRLFAEQEFATTFSLSKQFVVYGPKGTPTKRSKPGLIALNPAFLTVSCERIKKAVVTEIDGPERAQFSFHNTGEGKIFVVLHPGVEQQVIITPIKGSPALSYRIDLPNQIEGARLIEAVTEAVLLEIVNRHAAENFTQLPRWLALGISSRVKSGTPETLLLQQGVPISKEIPGMVRAQADPLVKIRKNLETYSALTFDELSWPDNLPPDRASHYEECSHLFVDELLRLKDGRDGLRKTLEELSRTLNWQVAFLRAFRPHFRQLLDVEKWWALRIVNLTGRDASQLWSRAQCVERLDAALRVSVQHFAADSSPSRGDLSLQEIVSQWEPAQQKPALTKTLNQLRALRIRLQPEFLPILDEYCATLEYYLKNVEKTGLAQRVLLFRDSLAELKLSTRNRLDEADLSWTALRNRPKESTREEAIRSALEVVGNPKPANK